jgi:hypothetical protein
MQHLLLNKSSHGTSSVLGNHEISIPKIASLPIRQNKARINGLFKESLGFLQA